MINLWLCVIMWLQGSERMKIREVASTSAASADLE